MQAEAVDMMGYHLLGDYRADFQLIKSGIIHVGLTETGELLEGLNHSCKRLTVGGIQQATMVDQQENGSPAPTTPEKRQSASDHMGLEAPERH